MVHIVLSIGSNSGAPVRLEDLHGYGRLHEMLSKLKPRDWRNNEMLCSGGVYDVDEMAMDFELGTPIIDYGKTLSMSCKPFLGVTQAGKYLPTKFAPLTLEIHFAPARDAVYQNGAIHPAGNVNVGETAQPLSRINTPSTMYT